MYLPKVIMSANAMKKSMEVLDRIPVELDLERVLAALRIQGQSPQAIEAERTAALAQSLARPRALYAVSYVEGRDGDRVNVDGVWFSSRVLRRNLEEVHRVFPSIVTLGRELEEAAGASGDLVRQFHLDAIGNLILRSSRMYLASHLERRFRLGRISGMNPGSLADWPLEEQGKLFSLFGDVEGLIGVRLTDQYLMIPRKTVSGIYFPTEVPFHSCQLCPRARCVGRKAAFDQEMAERYGTPL